MKAYSAARGADEGYSLRVLRRSAIHERNQVGVHGG